MSITGLLPPATEFLPYTDNIAAGPVEYFSAYGSRSSVSTAVNGDDIWVGTATTLPIPPQPGGQQMTVVSTSVNDAALGTGLQNVEIHYVNSAGLEISETIPLNGINPVNTAATNIRFVNEFYGKSVGTGGAAAGTITIYALGAPATVYSQINPGHFKAANTAKMVPANKVCLIESFAVSGGAAAGGKSAMVNLRATAHHGLLLPVSPNPVFQGEDSAVVFNSGIFIKYDTPILIPAFAVIKCTSFATAAGADVTASWHGKLVQAPV